MIGSLICSAAAMMMALTPHPQGPPTADGSLAAARIADAVDANMQSVARGMATRLEIVDFEIDPLIARRWCLGEVPKPPTLPVICRIQLQTAILPESDHVRCDWAREPGSADSIPGYSGEDASEEWDGQTWCLYSKSSGIAQLTGARQIGSSDETLPLVNMTSDPSFFSKLGLVGSLRGNLIPTLTEKHGVGTVVYTHPSGKYHWSVSADMTHPQRIRELRKWRNGEGDSDAGIDYVTIVTMDDWRPFGNGELPFLVTYRTWRASANPSIPNGLARCTEYRRTQLEELSERPALLDLPIGTDVADDRIGATYRIGGTVVYLAGMELQTTKPIAVWRDIPSQLPQLVIPALLADSPTPQNSATPVRRWLMLAAAIMAVGCALFALFAPSKPAGRSRSPIGALALTAVGGASLAVLAIAAFLPIGERKSEAVVEATAASLDEPLNTVSPFRGRSAHRFESITAGAGETRVLEHHFVLTNSSDKVIDIDSIKTSCGCTRCEPSTKRVGPGETFRVRSQLTFRGSGSRNERAWLELSDGGIHELRLAGHAAPPAIRWIWPTCVKPGESPRFYRVEVTGTPAPEALQLRHFSDGGIPPILLTPVDAKELGTVQGGGDRLSVRWVASDSSPSDGLSPSGDVRRACLNGVPWHWESLE